MWKINSILLETNGSLKKTKRKLKKKNTYRQMTTKHDNPKPMRFSKSSSKREVYSNTILP